MSAADIAVIMERLDSMAKDIAEIKQEVLIGNGRQSLKARVASLEAIVGFIKTIAIPLIIAGLLGIGGAVWNLFMRKP
jgi:hypothetical protein